MTPFDLAQRYIGVKERAGEQDHPLIRWWLSLCDDDPNTALDMADEVPWCSAFVNGIMWEFHLSRSKSLAARSWLGYGVPVALEQAIPSHDVVVLKRGTGIQPGPEVVKAPGHVGFFAGLEGSLVRVLGGNQGDAVSIASFPINRVLGVRRIS